MSTADRAIGRLDFDPDGCPECSGIDIEGDSVDIDGQVARQEVRCHDCNCHWVDVYQIAHRRVIIDHGETGKGRGFYTIFIQEDGR